MRSFCSFAQTRPPSLDRSVVVDLVEWAQECFTAAAEPWEAIKRLLTEQANARPETHELYWNAVCKFGAP